MLKNYIKLAKIRNFIQTGYFYDYCVKKIIVYLYTNTTKIFIIFFEKFIIEYMAKNFKNTINTNNKKVKIFYNFFITVIMFLNILIILMFAC